MHIRTIIHAAILAIVCGLFVSCAPADLSLADAPPPIESDSEYLLGSGDRLKLSLYGDDSFSGEYSVSAPGNLSLPLIGNIKASGKTIEQLQDDIVEQLAAGYYSDPRLSAEIVAFRPFYILGEVNRPGNYPYTAGLTLHQAVAIAGGYTYRANTGKLTLQREGAADTIRIRSDGKLIIGPGDTILILERYF